MKTEAHTISTSSGAGPGKVTIYAITIFAVLLIGYALVQAMRSYVPSLALNAKRGEERTAARKDVEATAQKELHGNYAIIIPHNGVVRLPIERAMEMTIQGMQNPASFRSNLLARAENAAKPPPKAPEAPSKFE